MSISMHPEARRLDDRLERIIGAAIHPHRVLGPGLLEAPFETRPCHEMADRGVTFERQKPISLQYGDVSLPCREGILRKVYGCPEG